MKIVLISCVSKKLAHKAKARDLYVSPLFKYNLLYSEKILKPKKIFILSAKYGLLGLNKIIKPYEKTLNDMKSEEIKKWAEKVLEKLKLVSNPRKDNFVFLAGKKYRKYILPHLEEKNVKVPLKKLGIGKQLGFLKKKVGHV